jgi:hypothetical protein
MTSKKEARISIWPYQCEVQVVLGGCYKEDEDLFDASSSGSSEETPESNSRFTPQLMA